MKTYSEINVGDSEEFEKTISESDIYIYAGVVGDFNPAHISETAGKNSKFHGRIAHGMLTGSFISTVLGMKLPGPGTIYLSQSLNFKGIVRIGDTVKAVVTAKEKLEKGRIKLETICYNQNGDIVVEGEALVIAPRDK